MQTILTRVGDKRIEMYINTNNTAVYGIIDTLNDEIVDSNIIFHSDSNIIFHSDGDYDAFIRQALTVASIMVNPISPVTGYEDYIRNKYGIR